MKRSTRNPILTRDDVPDVSPIVRDATSVFNPGAVKIDNRYMLLVRVQTRGRETVLMVAESNDGTAFTIRPHLLELPRDLGLGERVYHVYDPRLTVIDGEVLVAFSADTDDGCRLGVARLHQTERLELLSVTRDRHARNAVLFPEKIGGHYVRLERPNQSELPGGVMTGDRIFLATSDDLVDWRLAGQVMVGRPHYWDELIGSGPPPIRVREGWLHIYHGVATHFAAANIYQAGVCLLDRNDPSRVLARGRNNILEPREIYEQVGQVPNVVFPTGIVVEDVDDSGCAAPDSAVRVYYGAAEHVRVSSRDHRRASRRRLSRGLSPTAARAMNLHAIDWLIVAALLAALAAGALVTTRYTKSVSAFLAANRCGGRYLIAMALAMAGTGVISLVYWFEIYYEAGFSAYWWSSLTEPALIVIALSGWIVYRFRQTRAMTLAQFFEMRYSRNFRVFAGLVGFLSGIINFGIYPAVGSRFFIALCGLPPHFTLLGVHCSTFVALMAGLLCISILFTFAGGQIAVMVTDFIQGAFANVVFLILIVYLLGFVFRWDQIESILLAAPEGKSPIHPLHMSGQQDFGLAYFLIAVAIVFYTFNSWQGTSGYNCCARDAHEAKMAGVLYGWRFRVLLTVTLVVPIAVLTLTEHPDFATQAAQLQQSLDGIEAPTPEQKVTLQNQLRIPYALALLLPPGLLGLVVAAMLAAFISTHDTYLHSWGSIFLQDVVLPLRKKPLAARTHLWLLRLSILGVAIFVFCFSILIKPTQFIAMFFAITGAVFVGGAGSAIIGGLYWKRGSTWGAWAAMLTGMLLSGLSVIVKQVDVAVFERLAVFAPWLGRPALYIRSELTGQELTFIAMCCAIATYVLVSLLGPQQVTDMDRLLNRKHPPAANVTTAATTWLERLGIDREFTRRDRWVAYVSIAWPLGWTAVFVGLTVWSLAIDVPDTWWASFWRVWIWVFTGGAMAVTLWFIVGGIVDLRAMFRQLRSFVADPEDDGRVRGGPSDVPPRCVDNADP